MSRRSGGALLAACVLALALPAVAQAHARLVGTSPIKGAVLERQPPSVVFYFSEPIEASFGSVRVFDPAGGEVESGAPFRPEGQSKALAIALRPNLPDGTYRATYHILSADSHPVVGGIAFSIGKPTAGGVEPISELPGQGGTGRFTAIAFGADRWLGNAAIGLAVGALFFLVWVWRPARRPMRSFDRRFRLLVWIAVTTGVLASLVALPLEGADAAGTPVWRALHRSVIDDVVHTRFGSLMLARAAAWVVLGGILLIAAARKQSRTSLELAVLAMLPIGSLLVSPALAGHARTETPVALLFPADVVHVTAMSLWLGGLATLVAAVPAALRELEPPDADALLLVAVTRFSRIALISVVALAASGTVQAVIDVGSIRGLYDTGYGRIVLVKSLLFLALIGLGAANRERLIPALARAVQSATRAGRLASLLRRNLRAEVALIAVVLGITAVLVVYAPPGGSGGFAAPAVGPGGRQLGQTTLGEATLSFTVDPARVGQNTINLYLLDASGRRPYKGARNVRTVIIAPDRSAQTATATLVGPGHYANSAAQFSGTGLWTVKVLARLPNAPKATAEIFVPIGG